MAENDGRVDPPEIGHMPSWARRLIRRANSITPKPGFSEQDMMTVWERCEGRCAVSGLPFNEKIVGTGKAKRPFAPSLDRINRSKGYTVDNVRLVYAVANFAMNAWGEDPVRALAEGLVKQIRREKRPGSVDKWRARQDARIAQAEEGAKLLTGDALKKQKGRIAALKRARTLGPAGLMKAAKRAGKRRRSS